MLMRNTLSLAPTDVAPVGKTERINPSPSSVTYSTSPPSKMSISVRQPSSSGNSEEVTVTPEPAAQEPPVGVGLLGVGPLAVGLLTGGVTGADVVGVTGDGVNGVTGAGVKGVTGAGVNGVGETPSQPQSTSKVVDVAASGSDSPGKIPAGRDHDWLRLEAPISSKRVRVLAAPPS